MSTNLILHLSAAFLQEVTGSSTGTGGTGTQNGTWAYLWNNRPPTDYHPTNLPAGTANNFTALIDQGQLTSNVTLGSDGDYDVTIPLTDGAQPTVQGGTVYLLVQSENPATHHDLTQLIGNTEANIQPNTSAWNFGFAQFEFTLQNAPADQGDLTAISGFAQHLAVNVSYSNGTSDSRGYALSGAALTTALTNPPGEAGAAQTYPAAPSGTTPYSPLDGQTSMVISPSNGNFGPSLYPASNWNSYLTDPTTGFGTLTDVLVSGITNGEVDASGIWHNSQYYSYTMTTQSLASGAWGPSGTYYRFNPTTTSQTQGYMLISEATLQQNLYAAGQGTLSLWQDSALTEPYIVPGSGSPPGTAPTSNLFNPSVNNEWGNIFTNVFTGFTAGYWGTIAEQSNPLNRSTTDNLAGGPLDLDNTQNWNPAYAFDNHRTNAIPSYQHNDAYSEEFFNNSNVYGSAFSDNLSNGLSPTPLISLSQPGSSTNVGNIDLYAYGSQEIDPYYRTPIGANYLALPSGQTDYLVPTAPSAGLQLQVVGQAAGLFVRSDATLTLGLYQGNGHFTYIPVNSGGNLWQTYNVTGSAGNWTINPGGSNQQGTLQINNLPTPASTQAGQVYWYQLAFSDDSGDQKVYDFYATASGTTGQLQTGATSVAADGGAQVNTANLQSSFMQVVLNPATSMPSGLLTFTYNTQLLPANGGPGPAAPVAGTLSGGTFTAIANQDGTGQVAGSNPSAAPSVSVDADSILAFGWTGTNNASHGGMPTNPSNFSSTTYTPGLVTSYTNKINAGNIAMVSIYQESSLIGAPLTATADLDGQWQTSSTGVLGNGTYTVTMTEYLPDGVTPLPLAPASAALTVDVLLDDLTLQSTPDGHGLQFAASSTPETVAGNWLQIDQVPGTHLTQGAEILMYATRPDGALVARDGHTGGGVTIASATLARIGSMRSDDGQHLVASTQELFLPDDQQLHFALLTPDGNISAIAGSAVTMTTGGALMVRAAGLELTARVDNHVSVEGYLADQQRSTDLPLVYLQQDDRVHVDVVGSSANVNTAHFVRFDINPSTGAMSVDGIAYGNTDAFRDAVRANWDVGFSQQNGHGTFESEQNWTVTGQSGFYTPVLLTQSGDVFVIGTANVDDRAHVQTFGQNTFSFEDLRADQHSDFDFNDMCVKLTMGWDM